MIVRMGIGWDGGPELARCPVGRDRHGIPASATGMDLERKYPLPAPGIDDGRLDAEEPRCALPVPQVFHRSGHDLSPRLGLSVPLGVKQIEDGDPGQGADPLGQLAGRSPFTTNNHRKVGISYPQLPGKLGPREVFFFFVISEISYSHLELRHNINYLLIVCQEIFNNMLILSWPPLY